MAMKKTRLVGSSKYPVLPTVKSARIVSGFTVHLTFADGVEREIDLESHLKGPIFEPLRDPQKFAELRIDDESDTICWPNGADIAPETLYYDGEPPWVKEKRSVRSTRKTTQRRHLARQASTRRRKAVPARA